MFLFGTGLFSFVFVDFLLNVRSRKLVSRACPNFSLVSVLFIIVGAGRCFGCLAERAAVRG